MTKVTMIVWDMDGTIADLYGVEGWLERLRAENPLPYEIAEPMVDFEEMNALLLQLQALGWRIAVTSWLLEQNSAPNVEPRQNKRKDIIL